jgi:hypothetical protein
MQSGTVVVSRCHPFRMKACAVLVSSSHAFGMDALVLSDSHGGLLTARTSFATGDQGAVEQVPLVASVLSEFDLDIEVVLFSLNGVFPGQDVEDREVKVFATVFVPCVLEI